MMYSNIRDECQQRNKSMRKKQRQSIIESEGERAGALDSRGWGLGWGVLGRGTKSEKSNI